MKDKRNSIKYTHKKYSMLEEELRINPREFLENYLKANPEEIANKEEYLSYLSNLAMLKQKRQDIENLSENGKHKGFYDFMIDSLIDSRIKTTLIRIERPKHEDPGLTTLLSKDIFNKMRDCKINNSILTGKRYYDLKSKTNFDVLIGAQKIENLAQIDSERIAIVPYVSYKEVKDYQEYLLSLNGKFPKIEKAFLGGFEGHNPFFYKLIKTSFGEKKFVPGSYTLLD